MFKKTAVSAVVAGLLLGSAASAATDAAAWTDLNLRAGPGAMYEIMGVIPKDGIASVEGCLDASSWCQVTYEGMSGWASGDYLTTMVDDAPVAIYPNREQIMVGTVTFDDTSTETAVAGTGFGAIVGAMIAGPVGAAVGAAVVGGAAMDADPGPQVSGFVLSNPVETVWVDGEVVVGAGIPDAVTLIEVPDSEFSYAYINGMPVVVERTGRRVVLIAK